MKSIPEDGRLVFDMLVTPSMYPLPHDVIILENHGPEVIIKNGSVQEAGDHMKVEFSGTSFLEWARPRVSKPLWFWDKKHSVFNKILLEIEEPTNATANYKDA